MNNPIKIIVHHTGGTDRLPRTSTAHHTVDIIDETHKTRWPGFTSKVFKNKNKEFYHVGYHFVIEKDGKTTQTRGFSETGAHCIGMNTSSIGICLTGNFDVEMPSNAQIKAFKKLYNKIVKQYPNLHPQDIVPHRRYATKSCFGDLLPDNYFSGIITEATPISKRTKEQNNDLIKLILSILISRLFGKRMK